MRHWYLVDPSKSLPSDSFSFSCHAYLWTWLRFSLGCALLLWGQLFCEEHDGTVRQMPTSGPYYSLHCQQQLRTLQQWQDDQWWVWWVHSSNSHALVFIFGWGHSDSQGQWDDCLYSSRRSEPDNRHCLSPSSQWLSSSSIQFTLCDICVFLFYVSLSNACLHGFPTPN